MKNGAWEKGASALKKNIYALYLASRDPRVPASAKIMIGMVVAYALSPIDLIPDFIPVIGYMDDLFLLPIGIWLAIRLIPQDVWRECHTLAQKKVSDLAPNRRATAVIVIIWCLSIGGFLVWVAWLVRGMKST